MGSMSQAGPSTHTFLPLPPKGLTKPPPIYRQPALLATYSHQPDRSIQHDDSSMVYYRRAPVGSDLNHGFDRRIERAEDEDEHLDGLCESLRTVWEGGRQGERRGGIITWRGMITRIMVAPFEHRDEEKWEMTAIALDGSIYIELHDPPDVRKERRNRQSAHAVQTYMGYSYESFSTVQAPDKQELHEGDPESWSGDVNTNVQWCNIVRSAIGDVPLCLGGEVDCIRAEPGTPHPGLEACMELKTNMVIRNDRQQKTFERKLLKHWAQSWLLGVPTVEVGFRDEDGIVQVQQEFNTIEIPQIIGSLPNPTWHPAPCLHFLHGVLSLLRTHVLPTDAAPPEPLGPDEPLPPAQVWRFSFIPRRGCELWHVGEIGTEDGRWGGVLQEDYVRWRMSR